MAEQVEFQVQLPDGRTAQCWQAEAQPYQDMVIDAGLVTGIDPDPLYFRLVREEDDDPLIVFMRVDEMLALVRVCIGAVWSLELEMVDKALAEIAGEDPEQDTTGTHQEVQGSV